LGTDACGLEATTDSLLNNSRISLNSFCLSLVTEGAFFAITGSSSLTFGRVLKVLMLAVFLGDEEPRFCDKIELFK
jgi:hypothetical protein